MRCISREVKPVFSTHLRLDLPIIEPNYVPLPGQMVVGYYVYEKPRGCLTRPKPESLSFLGWASVVCLGFLFWPLMCVPCCLSACYEGYQVPVYQ